MEKKCVCQHSDDSVFKFSSSVKQPVFDIHNPLCFQIYLRQVEGSVEEKKSSFCVPKCTFFVFGIKSRKGG